MDVNLSGTLNINLTNTTINKNFIATGFSLYSSRKLISAIDFASTIAAQGCSRTVINEEIEKYIKTNIVSSDNDGIFLTFILKEFLKLFRYPVKTRKMMACYLDKKFYECSSKNLLLEKFNNRYLRGDNSTRIETSDLYLKFRIFNVLSARTNVFEHLILAFNKTSKKSVNDIGLLIDNKNYTELYKIIFPNGEIPIETVFYWCNSVRPTATSQTTSPVFNVQLTTEFKNNKLKEELEQQAAMIKKMAEDFTNIINNNTNNSNNTNIIDNSGLIFDEELGTSVLDSLNALVSKFTELTDVLSDHKSAIYNFVNSAETITKT